MTTVLLRLSGPLQSYGTTSRWEERATLPRPTKSAVLGLLANALGPGHGPSRFADLVFSVRCDRPGHLEEDFQTAGGGHFGWPTAQAAAAGITPTNSWYGAPRYPHTAPLAPSPASWKPADRGTVMAIKQYVVDASFLVGLSGCTPQQTNRITTALAQPYGLLYLGRRSCPPSRPILYGTTADGADVWPHRMPLVPEASTATPQVWRQGLPGPGTYAVPEQPGTTRSGPDYLLLHVHPYNVSPPTTPAESTQ
ncbi:type I-E CRISPR-associated protein Cas5/CasD [Streptomyces sp. NBC_00582]|uniref:type I-E CRISPR-associated protein Cas5/CasD n=1 Tax=Streptomyces sp. NBC_00582 TaxID=2975783 RepID=UPI002E82256A|nr:type I-E CRISPR-associated protein Cas5/CasD [Streptomyces sp. NBC_00582]WUB68423.1 type I-E CRISPR-associated protein Cas5/CasD [Streptomyces sp. NBC_00582]